MPQRTEATFRGEENGLKNIALPSSQADAQATAGSERLATRRAPEPEAQCGSTMPQTITTRRSESGSRCSLHLKLEHASNEDLSFMCVEIAGKTIE